MDVCLPVSAPERSIEQRDRALARANEVRGYRAELKRDMKAGRGRSVCDVVIAPADDELTMKVFDLLLAVPKVGRVKANKWLTRARISPSKTLGGMTERQRRELAGVLRSAGFRPRVVL